MGRFLKMFAGAVADHYMDRLRAHTVERVRKAALVATFPLVTAKANDLGLWRACARVAWHGLRSRHANALDYFVAVRARVEESQRFTRGVERSGMGPSEAHAMRNEHLDAVLPLPVRPSKVSS